MKAFRTAITVIAAFVGILAPAGAQIVTFDFDSGSPALSPFQNVPLSQTMSGVTAGFSSPGLLPGFSVQSAATTGFALSQFSGLYLYPNNQNRNRMDILFTQFVTSIAVTFATAEQHDPGGSASLLALDAYVNSTATPPVASATASGTFLPGETFPQGTIILNAGATPFNLVTLVVPFQADGATEFLIDNVVVSVVEPGGGGGTDVPEPPATAILAIGLGGIACQSLRRRTGTHPCRLRLR